MSILQMGLALPAHLRKHHEEKKPFLPDLRKAVEEGVHVSDVALVRPKEM